MMSALQDPPAADGSYDPGTVYVDVEGEHIPRYFETSRPLADHVACLKSLEMRHDDVLVAAFRKSGTHWLWEITSMLLAGKAEHEKRVKDLAMMEATAIEHIQAQPSPRVLNSHLPLRLLPRQIREKKVKVIHVYRNVKDVVVSGYFHFRQVPVSRNITVENMMDIICSNEVPGPKYVKYLREMEDYHKNNPDVPMFITSYEDTKEDPQNVIGRLAEFLGVEASPQLVEDIAEATHILKMKEADRAKQKSHLSSVEMYRQGRVGGWKNHLTVAQSERLDAEVTQLKSCDYHFRYTL
ncbi:sulfotransferase 1A1-like isoform X2 [Babylonia areolata]